MTVTETDLELLEQWLDGELEEGQAEALRQRLPNDPALSQALDQLRGDRKMRTLVWQALEPRDADVERVVSGVRSGMRREDVWASRVRTIRNITAVAAAIAIVFMGGWVSRSRLHVGPVVQQSAPNTTVAANNPAPNDVALVNMNLQVDRNGISNVRPVYRLVLLDPMFRQVSVQELENVTDPNAVKAELAQFQSRLHGGAAGQPAPVFVDHPQPQQPGQK